MYSFSSQTPLPVSGAETYRGMAFDGCRYYLTGRHGCAVTVLDRDLRPIRTAETRRAYGPLCFDPRRGCFWALAGQCRSTVFRLDPSLGEIYRLELRTEDCRSGPLTGLSLCCESGKLLLSSGSQLLEADPDTGEARLLWDDRGCSLILAPLCMPPYILLCALRGCRAFWLLLDRDGGLLAEEERPDTAAALALDPHSREVLALTARQGCYPHLVRLQLEEALRDALRPCGRELRCREESPCGGILESTALVETAIAHILNAEGEKLQAVIAGGADPDQLLAANESVQRALLCATRLEQLLVARLAELGPSL